MTRPHYRPSIFKRAARIVEESLDKYGKHSVACAALGRIGANEYETALFEKHYKKDFGLGEYWFGPPYTVKNCRRRVKALLRMERLAKKLNEKRKGKK